MSQAPEPKSPRRASFFPGTAALFLALLAPALGGGTSPSAVALLLSGIGLAAVVIPATRLRPGFLLGAALLLALTLTWLWPASLNHLPWRDRLEAAGFPLPWSSSPEPWVSLRASLLLLAGLVWAGWCSGQPWTSRDRRKICEGLAVGIGLIAALALATRDRHVPGWPPGTGLGPFANRNQSATLFATGAFLTVASGAGRFRRHRHSGKPPGPRIALALGWLCLLGIHTAALALDNSRSGPLLFAGMTLAWSLTMMPGWKRKPETAATAVAVLLLLATLFLLTGRGVITRLATSHLMDFRLKIFSDTLRMICASPWTGTGLGCFDVIFPLYRDASILQERVIHPESDWLWLAAETGLPALLAMAGLLAWMAAQAWRALAHAEDRPIRLALCVACLGFLAHSFIDVPGHRLGTIMPALLLLGLAAAADDAERPLGPLGPLSPSHPPAWPLRLAALPVLLTAAACLTAIILKIPIPLANAEPSLPWTPLDWRLRAVRAETEAARGEWSAALGDFRRARFLEPDYAGLPFEEGLCWLAVAPQFAIEPWQEALRLIPPERRGELYQNMLAHAFPTHRELHAALWSMAAPDPALELLDLGWAQPEEFRAQIEQILREDPALSRFNTAQLRTLFTLWMAKGDAPRLAPMLRSHPAWLKAGYRPLAEYFAVNGDFVDAVDVMDRYLPAPSMPSMRSTPSIPPAAAATRFQQDPGDISAGLALYQEAIAAGRDPDALDILRTIAANSPCPPYVHYLEAQLLIKQGRLPEAWAELEKCPYPR